ncbi:MAG: flagellar biosynthesis anti-sigma factor FlgM [Planctomycetales bacterium]|nr:flagellar biosynthesis anti-sigma factor FlgM [Planctomycetales bacterium]
MQIYGFGQIHQAHAVKPTQRFEEVRDAAAASKTQYGPDELEISSEAQEVLASGEASTVRADKIANIREQIANGTYETPEKLEIAMNRLFDVLG